MRKVTVDPAALEDIAEGSRFYNRAKPGLGKVFREFVKSAFKKIAKQPELYVFIIKPYRGHYMDKFPFTIYYRETEESVHIMAVLHQHSHPDRWKQRLKNL
jgi:plasmid stabilization system protein ParE